MVSEFVDLSLLDLTFSCVSTKPGEKDSFSYLYKLQISLAKLFLSYKSAKSFVTVFYLMTTSPLPGSVWYLQWRVQLSPSVLYSVLSVIS